MGTRQRLIYTDSNGDTKVLAERRGALGKADRIVHMRRGVGFDYAKVHGSNQLFGNIPVGISNFQSSEPEIFLQDYQQGSWVDFARIWAEKGAEIQSEGKTVVKLWGFDKFIGQKSVNIQNVSGTVVDVMQAGLNDLPSGSDYVLDYPTDVTHPDVNDYSNTGKFNKTFQDMYDKYGYAIDVLPETDGNGNYKVRFEPIGYGGAVDDIKTEEGDVIQRWNKKDTSKIVNSVTVVGKDSNGATIEEKVTDSNSINEYGERVHPQNPIHIDYPITSSEAQTIGQNFLQPDPANHGRVRSNLYQGNVFNDSVHVIDPQRNIDATFTVASQKTYFDDDTATELDLDFEQEGLERKARGEESLWSERAKLYPSETQDVGNQGLETGEAESNTLKDGGVGDDNDRGDDLSNVAKTGGIQQLSADNIFGAFNSVNFSGAAVNDSGWSQPTTGTPASGSATASTNALSHHVIVSIDGSDTSPLEFYWAIEQSGDIKEHGYGRLDTSVDSRDITGQVGNNYWAREFNFSLEQFTSDNTLEYDLHIQLLSGSASIDGDMSAAPVNHVHPDDINTDNQVMGLTDDIITVDDFHGGGTGDDQHGGSTDQKDIDVTVEDITTRS